MIYILGQDKVTEEPILSFVLNRGDLKNLQPPIHLTLEAILDTDELEVWVKDRGRFDLSDLLSDGLKCQLMFCDVETNEETVSQIGKVTDLPPCTGVGAQS